MKIMSKRMKLAIDLVLRLRQQREESACREFVKAQQEAQTRSGNVRRLNQTLCRQDRWARVALAEADNHDFAPYRMLVTQIRSTVVAEMRRLSVAQAALQDKRQALLEARRRRQAAQRLRDRLTRRRELAVAQRTARGQDDLHAMHLAGRLAGATAQSSPEALP